MKGRFHYLIIRALTFPFLFLPYSWVHFCGRCLGSLAYYLVPKFRKRTLSNLSLATTLYLKERDLFKIARLSFQNLMITLLEYAKFSWEKDIHNIAHCVNPQEASALLKEGKGIIFFCGHQANWEVLFLEATSRMPKMAPGVAIGRPVKNESLYRWILRVREKFGGKIVTPKNAIKEGLRALKSGAFLGIVGDQGMPDSGYFSDFFGRRAFTSPIPALLAYRTNRPILVATTVRKEGKYEIHYSEPIWPNPEAPLEKEVDRLMRASLAVLEKSIAERPGQWLWQHNRWKQQILGKVKRPYRQEAFLIILPLDEIAFSRIAPDLSAFREIYPLEFITVLTPKKYKHKVALKDAEILTYEKPDQMFIKDYRFKLVFNFSGERKIRRHFLRLSAFHVLSLSSLEALAKDYKEDDFSSLLKKALCHAS